MKTTLTKFFTIALTSLLPFAGANAGETGACTQWILDYVNNYPDFPIPGIQFKFYSPLLKDPAAFKKAIQACAEKYRNSPVDTIAALDARGFIFGTALAYEMNLPLVLVRKGGKLPGDVASIKYDLEYGSACLEIEKNLLKPNEKVLIVDDIIATGGTVKAAGKLIEQEGAEVYEVLCLIELTELKGRENIPYPLYTLLSIGNN